MHFDIGQLVSVEEHLQREDIVELHPVETSGESIVRCHGEVSANVDIRRSIQSRIGIDGEKLLVMPLHDPVVVDLVGKMGTLYSPCDTTEMRIVVSKDR